MNKDGDVLHNSLKIKDPKDSQLLMLRDMNWFQIRDEIIGILDDYIPNNKHFYQNYRDRDKDKALFVADFCSLLGLQQLKINDKFFDKVYHSFGAIDNLFESDQHQTIIYKTFSYNSPVYNYLYGELQNTKLVEQCRWLYASYRGMKKAKKYDNIANESILQNELKNRVRMTLSFLRLRPMLQSESDEYKEHREGTLRRTYKTEIQLLLC